MQEVSTARTSVALGKFAASLTANFRIRLPAQPEDQLKPSVQRLLREIGSALGRNVATRSEAQVSGLGAKPDIGVAVDGLIAGFVELKAPGKGARPERFRGGDREQWRKFQSLPNLIYTDANEWTLYRTGEQRLRVRLHGDVTTEGPSAIAGDDAARLTLLLLDFFSWTPLVPSTPKALAEVLAPLCHLVRHDVLEALKSPDSALSQLASDWRTFLFPDADDAQFADAYAQTVTYALLLARFSGSSELGTQAAARTIARGHAVLAQTLRILTDEEARREIDVGIDLLERAIGAVDPDELKEREADPWLYFYEDFLAAYDPKLRKDRGVYYTPIEVVGAQVRLVAELLEMRFGKDLTFADDDVVLLDPAVGTGTYPLAAMADALDRVRQRFGDGALAGRASTLARNTHGFELLIGAYAVAHLRLSERVLAAGGELPQDGAHVYLTDTLESPFAEPPGQIGMFLYRALSDEHRRAQRVKADARVLVCIGNPPYDRQVIDAGDLATQRKGGWVRFGDHGDDGILDDFLAPARQSGAGVHLKNLYNDYVYFWRWALWKVFDSTGGPGVVSFITAASYLRGPGFVGMREVMRRTFDELWIIDLEGDNLGARKTENVFAIQTPVAIAVGVRYGDPNPDVSATVHYSRIDGHREEKLTALDAIGSFSALAWRECPSDWHAPFLPTGEGDYFAWPLLTDLFPWQHTGVEMKRTWPIGSSPELLGARWKSFLSLRGSMRADSFRTTRDRDIYHTFPPLPGEESAPPLAQADTNDAVPSVVRYGYRSMDRQWVLADSRFGDFMRPSLWTAAGDKQIYLTSMLTGVLGLGPAAVVTPYVPDRHHFRGSYSGKDVVPLWRDAQGSTPNVTDGLLDVLAMGLQMTVTPEDLFAYVYAVLASESYVERFSEELTIPGPRVPVTRDPALFSHGAGLGRWLIWVHTYGERFVDSDAGRPRGPVRGAARNSTAVSESPEGYPQQFEYDAAGCTLRVGDGEFAPVRPEVWNFSVSGLHVVRSWLSYRMKAGAGRRSSPLDEIRPDRWTPRMTEELLELLWLIEATVDSQPEVATLVRDVVAGHVFRADELPVPSDAERRPPIREAGEERAQLSAQLL